MNINKFKKICKMSQGELKEYLSSKLLETHATVTNADGFIFAPGKFPVLLVAHLDTVHKRLPASIYYNPKTQRLSALEGIGGDDRCGVYMILEIIRKYNCSVLFTEDEEIGGVGADKFIEHPIAKTVECNYIIELDRRGKTDAVFYDCDNPDFTKFVCQEYFKEEYGSFSDISVIAPALGVAAVNLSSGYYSAHTVLEYVVVPEVDQIIIETQKLLERSPASKFKYIEAKRYARYAYYAYSGYSGYSGYNGYRGYQGYKPLSAPTPKEEYFLVEYTDRKKDGTTQYDLVYAVNEDEAVGKFVKLHPDVPYSDIIAVEMDDSDADEEAESEKEAEEKSCQCCGYRIEGTPHHTYDGDVCKNCYLDYYSAR